jgi:hypothetical protein
MMEYEEYLSETKYSPPSKDSFGAKFKKLIFGESGK